jgi:hypothetical protein
LTFTIAETAPQFLLCFLGLGLLFSVFVYVCGSEISRALFCTSLNFNQVDLDSMHGEILNTYEDVYVFSAGNGKKYVCSHHHTIIEAPVKFVNCGKRLDI